MMNATTARERDRFAPSAEAAVLLHVWMVDPEKADAFVGSLSELFGRLADEAGLIASRVLESPDRASIAALLEMRTPADRRRLEQLPEVRATLDELHGAANLVVRNYQVTAAYRPASTGR